jgi:hypothetical protein
MDTLTTAVRLNAAAATGHWEDLPGIRAADPAGYQAWIDARLALLPPARER